MTKEEKKDEMKNKISMALKDPILQQGFEIICKNLAELEKENAKLKEEIEEKESNFRKFKADYQELCLLKDMRIDDKDKQIAEAEGIIAELLELIEPLGNFSGGAFEKAQRFIKGKKTDDLWQVFKSSSVSEPLLIIDAYIRNGKGEKEYVRRNQFCLFEGTQKECQNFVERWKIAELEKENAELRKVAEFQQSSNMNTHFENKKLKDVLAVGSAWNKGLNSQNKALEEARDKYRNMVFDKDEQLTKAKELLNEFMRISKASDEDFEHDYSELIGEAEQFLKDSEVEK